MIHRTCLLLLGSLAAPSAFFPYGAGAADAVPVGEIRIDGLVHVREGPVREAILLKPGEPYSQDALNRDREAILALGYFRSVSAARRAAAGRENVTFRVTEWPRVVLVRIVGNTVAERDQLRQLVSTQVGQVLCAPQLQQDVRAIEMHYRERGYVARVSDHLLEEATKHGILRFEIIEYAIGNVTVEAGTPELQERARKALKEVPPQLYRPEAVAVDQRRLLRVKGIKSAEAEVTPFSPGKVRIQWRLNTAQ